MFDIIISNPPYGKTGVEVTKRIIDEINYKEFVNLLPANDYIKRGKKYKLWQYVENVKDMESYRGFADAAVTTHIAKIQKTPNLFISADEFEIENFIDPSLTKFFYENNSREHYAIDKVPSTGFTVKNAGTWDVDKTVIIGYRDMAQCIPPIGVSDGYKWNVEKSIDFDWMLTHRVYKTNNRFLTSNINFNTKIERDNFVKFMYSEDGFRFYQKLWTALNTDGRVMQIGLIKVDWTKEWTVEEILKDYGYTAKEIQEVIDDLKNFKIGESVTY